MIIDTIVASYFVKVYNMLKVPAYKYICFNKCGHCNVLAVCLGKSTYARCGIILNTTPFEPGWRGYVTLELTNSTPLPARIYANEGIGQVLFFESDEECETSYDEKKGKYLDQVGVVPPRM